MNTQYLFFLALVFLLWAGIAATVSWLLMPDKFRRRVASIENEARGVPAGEAQNIWLEHAVKVSRPLARLAQPSEGWENSPMRLRFINAGWRNQSTPYFFFGAKTLLALILPLLCMLFGGERLLSSGTSLVMLALLLSACIGYYLPNMLLNHQIEVRQRDIFDSFPDALDLLTICVEAGLGLEAALNRVAEEIHLKSQVLGQEFQLMILELRAGFSKERALRNLALRTGVEDIDLLVAMLIQSDRFGTSMGESLRIHADNLRTKRHQRAEEAAAKISLKLLFPLIFMIFPTLMLILVGPAAMQIYRVLLPAMTGQH
jgi:tight adherence protein C